MSRLRWVPASDKINVASLNYRPVETGGSVNGKPLYIAEAPYKDAVHPGKVSEDEKGAFIPYDGQEKHVRVCNIDFSLGWVMINNEPVSGVPCPLLRQRPLQ
jgi:hypothetical protein